MNSPDIDLTYANLTEQVMLRDKQILTASFLGSALSSLSGDLKYIALSTVLAYASMKATDQHYKGIATDTYVSEIHHQNIADCEDLWHMRDDMDDLDVFQEEDRKARADAVLDTLACTDPMEFKPTLILDKVFSRDRSRRIFSRVGLTSIAALTTVELLEPETLLDHPRRSILGLLLGGVVFALKKISHRDHGFIQLRHDILATDLIDFGES